MKKKLKYNEDLAAEALDLERQILQASLELKDLKEKLAAKVEELKDVDLPEDVKGLAAFGDLEGEGVEAVDLSGEVQEAMERTEEAIDAGDWNEDGEGD